MIFHLLSFIPQQFTHSLINIKDSSLDISNYYALMCGFYYVTVFFFTDGEFNLCFLYFFTYEHRYHTD